MIVECFLSYLTMFKCTIMHNVTTVSTVVGRVHFLIISCSFSGALVLLVVHPFSCFGVLGLIVGCRFGWG